MKHEKEFKQILRKSGFKATDARLAVLEVLHASRRPMSAQAIVDALPRRGRAVIADQATVYRTVKSLKEKGVIVPIDLRHNHAHYELAGLAEHHHLVCIHCGRIEDVNHCGIEEVQAKVLRSSKRFASITDHALEFYGVCKNCAAKPQKLLK